MILQSKKNSISDEIAEEERNNELKKLLKEFCEPKFTEKEISLFLQDDEEQDFSIHEKQEMNMDQSNDVGINQLKTTISKLYSFMETSKKEMKEFKKEYSKFKKELNDEEQKNRRLKREISGIKELEEFKNSNHLNDIRKRKLQEVKTTNSSLIMIRKELVLKKKQLEDLLFAEIQRFESSDQGNSNITLLNSEVSDSLVILDEKKEVLRKLENDLKQICNESNEEPNEKEEIIQKEQIKDSLQKENNILGIEFQFPLEINDKEESIHDIKQNEELELQLKNKEKEINQLKMKINNLIHVTQDLEKEIELLTISQSSKSKNRIDKTTQTSRSKEKMLEIEIKKLKIEIQYLEENKKIEETKNQRKIEKFEKDKEVEIRRIYEELEKERNNLFEDNKLLLNQLETERRKKIEIQETAIQLKKNRNKIQKENDKIQEENQRVLDLYAKEKEKNEEKLEKMKEYIKRVKLRDENSKARITFLEIELKRTLQNNKLLSD